MAAHASHMLGARVALPLPAPFDNGENPFAQWL
jgi:hypothetical protein